MVFSYLFCVFNLIKILQLFTSVRLIVSSRIFATHALHRIYNLEFPLYTCLLPQIPPRLNIDCDYPFVLIRLFENFFDSFIFSSINSCLTNRKRVFIKVQLVQLPLLILRHISVYIEKIVFSLR